MKLNQNIEIIAVEAIAQSRVLLASKDIDLKDKDAICLSVLLSEGCAVPMEKTDSIGRVTTFNAYDFIEEAEKRTYLALFKRYLNDETIKIINDLLIPSIQE